MSVVLTKCLRSGIRYTNGECKYIILLYLITGILDTEDAREVSDVALAPKIYALS